MKFLERLAANSEKVLDYELVLHLETQGRNGEVYQRLYYFVTYKSGLKLLVLTTDEYDSSYQDRKVGDDFEAFESFEKVIVELERTAEYLVHVEWNRKLPVLLCFYPVHVSSILSARLKSYFRQELEGYDLNDFSEVEKAQLENWTSFVPAKFVKH